MTDDKPLKRQMPLPGARSGKARSDAMVRVDHAGEFGVLCFIKTRGQNTHIIKLHGHDATL